MTDPLVLIPGFMSDARLFLPQIVALGVRHSITLIMPTVGTTVEEMSTAAIPGLPAKFALIGHGLGGEVALDLIRRVPDRITRVALLATDPLSEAPQIAAAREARMVAAKAGRLLQAMAEDVPAGSLAPGEGRAETIAALQEMALGLGVDVYLRQSRALQRRPDQQKTLRRSMLPALILAGEFDTLVPVRRQEFTVGLMPYAKLQVIAGAGHLPSLEQPEAVTQALTDFLAGPMLLK